MAQQRAEVDAITADPAPPTFENTLVALERSGRRAAPGVRGVLHAGRRRVSTPGHPRDRGARWRRSSPRTPTRSRSTRRCSPASRRCSRRATSWASTRSRCGCSSATTATPSAPAPGSAPAEQDRLRALNAELSALTTEFGTRLLAEANAAAVHVTDPAQLDGLVRRTRSRRAGARRAGPRARRPPDHAGAADRAARARRAHRPRAARARAPRLDRRAACGGEHDTRELVLRIGGAAGRAGRACSGTRTTRRGSSRSAPPATRRGGRRDARRDWPRWPRPTPRAEADELAAGAGHPIEPWDRAFHAERVRRERYDRRRRGPAPVLRAGAGAARRRLPRRRAALRAALRRAARPAAPTTPTCGCSTSLDEDGPLGLFVADLYARDSKRGGAWMNSFVTQSHLLGTRPVVLNTLNIAKPGRRRADAAHAGQRAHAVPRVRPRPARAVLRRALPDVRRHRACRATSSSTRRRSTRCGWTTRRSSPHYARHHETGEPLARGAGRRGSPSPGRFGEGFATTEYLAADAARPGLAPARRRARSVDDVEALRGRRARGGRGRRAQRAAALPQHLLQPRLRRRLQRRRTTPTSGARCSTPTPSSGSPRTAACDRRERRALPPRAARPRRRGRPDGGLPRLPRPRPGDRPAARAPGARRLTRRQHPARVARRGAPRRTEAR